MQTWENFYVQWLTKENNILMVFYEDLTNGPLHMLLNDISEYLDLAYTKTRIQCLLKYKEGNNIFHRKPKCHNNGLFGHDIGSIPFSNHSQLKCGNQPISTANYSVPLNEPCTLNIYTKKHITWINSAIRRVKRATKERGASWPGVSQYENTQVKINICS